MGATPTLELAEMADSTGPVTERAREMLDGLRRLAPFDAAWLALTDPMSTSYPTAASTDLDESILRYLNGPAVAHDIERARTFRGGAPLSPSDLPYPAVDVPTWAECFLPAGFHEALGVALFAGGQRHVGHLVLFYRSEEPPPQVLRRRLHQLSPVLARGVDPLRSLAAAARVVKGAIAGAVLCCRGATGTLPGLDGDPLLAEGSPVLTIARSCIDNGQAYASFLWPCGGHHTPDGHVRVTVLASPDGAVAGLLGTVVLSSVTDLRGLTPREREVLGLLVDGCSNQQIARALVVAPRTVAAHLEHILAKLGAPTRTLAAVRAEREGLYVPPSPSPWPARPPTPPVASPRK
jgi:DNA-binding CsgD family transcriptional regulator